MGLTKQYRRYSTYSSFGVIGTNRSIQFVNLKGQVGKFVAVSACEKVNIWDLRLNVKISTLQSEIHTPVTCLSVRPPTAFQSGNTHIAVGHSDGRFCVYDLTLKGANIFHGHRGSVSTVAWDPEGMRVATGSADSEIVIWDIVSDRGMVRLKGHKGVISRLQFMKTRNILVSAGHDSFVKFWNLDNNHCFYTLSAHLSQVYDFVMVKDDSRLITGSADAELKVWSLTFKEEFNQNVTADTQIEDESNPSKKPHQVQIKKDIDFDDKPDNELSVLQLGVMLRHKGKGVCSLQTNGTAIICVSQSYALDMYCICSTKQMLKSVKKRNKRLRESGEAENETVTLTDELKQLQPFKVSDNPKVRATAADVLSDAEGGVRVVVMRNNNTVTLLNGDLEIHSSQTSSQPFEQVHVSTISQQGHRSQVRCICFDSVFDHIITASSESLKIWQRSSGECLLTIPCGYATCLILPPGDRHALVGTKEGQLQLFELGGGSLLEEVHAHDEGDDGDDCGLWGITLTHDKRGFVTGGSDKKVKFWTFDLVSEEKEGRRGKRLSFVQDKRILQVAEQVTCLKCSSDGRYLVVATLDMRETVYFMDSLKLLHEFYGKPLPCVCLDISDDSSLIVTGSKDSCIRIFQSQFGDIKRLLKNAHQGGVTGIRFIPFTHMFFSCGFNGTVKQWDADNFERIITLEAHHGIIRCLDVCPKGRFVASCGEDMSIRMWERTEEVLILEEEREYEREKALENTLLTQRGALLGEGHGGQATVPSFTTHETEKAVDQLLEALEIYQEMTSPNAVNLPPNQLMSLVYKTEDPLRFVLLVLRKIKSSEIEEVILILSLNHIIVLLGCLRDIVVRDWDVELCVRVLVIALQVNMMQMIASSEAAPIIQSLIDIIPQKTKHFQDMLGFNLAGLEHLQHRMQQKNQMQLFYDASASYNKKLKRKSRKERQLKAAILSI